MTESPEEPNVNGLPLSMVDQWREYWTTRSFAVSVPSALRRQYYPNDAAFSKAMREHLISLATYENFAGLATGAWDYESVVLLTDNVTCINCAGLYVKGKSRNSRLLTRFQSTYGEFRDLYAKGDPGKKTGNTARLVTKLRFELCFLISWLVDVLRLPDSGESYARYENHYCGTDPSYNKPCYRAGSHSPDCENFVVIRLVDDAKKIATGHSCSLGFRFWCRCAASLTPRPIQYAGYASATRNIITAASFHFMGVSPYTVKFLRLPTSWCYLRLIYPGAGVPENRIIFPLERNIFPLKDEFCESIKKGPTEFLEFIKKGLPLIPGLGYVNSAPHKTGAGISTPKQQVATSDAESVFFVVCHTSHSMAWYSCIPELIPLVAKANYRAAYNGGMCGYSAGLAPSTDTLNSASRHQIMVALAGLPKGRPVPTCAGSANPVNVTAPIEISTSSGDSIYMQVEDAIMATTPTKTYPKFVWRFVSGQNSTCLTTAAASERETRSQLPAVRLVFAARIRTEEVHHA
ncbi:host cell division inhibitor Icd-like protein [Salmonella enterica]|uniref:host cell division inhibitor Icd-like protein n=1 Tax=Salmonella enterica TaxID=28901 RepID=UPI003D310B4F